MQSSSDSEAKVLLTVPFPLVEHEANLSPLCLSFAYSQLLSLVFHLFGVLELDVSH